MPTVPGFADAAELIAAQHDVAGVVRTVVHVGHNVLGTDATFGAVAAIDGSFHMIATSGTRSSRFLSLRLEPGLGLGGLVAQRAEPIAVVDYPNSDMIPKTPLLREVIEEEEQLRSIECLPIFGPRHRVIALLYAASRCAGGLGNGVITASETLAAYATIRASAAVAAEAERRVALLQERQHLADRLWDTVARELVGIGREAARAVGTERVDSTAWALGEISRRATSAHEYLRATIGDLSDRSSAGDLQLASPGVLIVDGHPMTRRGLRAVLKSALPGCATEEVGTGADALAQAWVSSPDLILVGIGVDDEPAPSVLCSQLRLAAPLARIVLLAPSPNMPTVHDCLEAGADSCLVKDATEESLHNALRAAITGNRVIDPRVSTRPTDDSVLTRRGEASTARLTPREAAILELLREGCSNRAIAERLYLAETTVKGYVSGLLRKLGASSRLEAVARASPNREPTEARLRPGSRRQASAH